MSNATVSGKQLLSQRIHIQSIFIMAGLVVAAFFMYRSALEVGFIGDDFGFLNLNLQRIFSMSDGIYRPLGLILFSLFNGLFGDSAPRSLHILGISLHALNVYLFFQLVRGLIGNAIIALLAGVVWLFSPTAVEPIYWLSALVFYLPVSGLILLAMLLTHDKSVQVADAKSGKSVMLRFSISIAILLAISLLFHEIALVIPVMVFLMIYGDVFYPRPRYDWAMHATLWLPTMLVLVAYAALRIILHAPIQLLSYTVGERAGLLMNAIWRAFLPTEWGIWHLVRFIADLNPFVACAFVVLCLSVLVVIFGYSKQYRPIAWGIATVIITVLPPVLFATSTGGRYLYLASAMGVLTLALAANVVLQQVDKRALVLHYNANRARGFLRFTLLGLSVVLLGFNLSFTWRETKGWVELDQLVDRLQSQVTELVSSSVTSREGKPIHIIMIDFPVATLTTNGVSRAVHRALPQLTDLTVTQAYLNDRNPAISRARFGEYVELHDVIEMGSSGIVLVFCKREQTVYLVGARPIPCLEFANTRVDR